MATGVAITVRYVSEGVINNNNNMPTTHESGVHVVLFAIQPRTTAFTLRCFHCVTRFRHLPLFVGDNCVHLPLFSI